VTAFQIPAPPAVLFEEPRGHVLKARLARLFELLGKMLDEPVRVTEDARGRTVWLLDAVGYRIDRMRREVIPLRRIGGQVRRMAYRVELYKPLCTFQWIPYVLRAHGLSDSGVQRHLWRNDVVIRREEQWMAEVAYAQLRAQPRFRELRERTLPDVLALDPGLMRMALATTKERTEVGSERYTRIWRSEESFRAVERENPLLLPLAYVSLEDGDIPAQGDFVQRMHAHLREQGLSKSGWRYLARHGARFLFPFWTEYKGRSRLNFSAAILQHLERAGFPPPPSWESARRWIRCLSRGDVRGPGWQRLSPSVLGAYLREAARCEGSPDEDFWRADAPLVLAWARETDLILDKLQRRAGWPWALRQARDWERRRFLLESDGPQSWRSEIECFEIAHFQAHAVTTLERLVDEGAAFHNCLASLADECQAGRKRIFTITDTRDGKRLAVAELSWISAQKTWALTDLKGIANRPAPDAVLHFATALLREYATQAQGIPEPPADPIEALFDEAAREVEEEARVDCLGLGGSRLELPVPDTGPSNRGLT
jgi:hypothetical protein